MRTIRVSRLIEITLMFVKIRFHSAVACLAACIAATTLAAQTTPVRQAADLVITGGYVFNTESGEFVENSCIAVAEGRFLEIGGNAAEFKTENRIELGDDQHILPGLIDCHAHYNVRLVNNRREEFSIMPVVYLASGTTVTFSCGEFDPEGMLGPENEEQESDW